jgi:spore coat polysaccharide biosynthesis protein SpsF
MAGVAIVLQARLGSTRLSGKVLERIGGRTLIEHAVTRLRTSGYAVVLATTTRAEDAAVAGEGARLGLEVFRGDEADVLGRYRAAAEAVGADVVVRATADNPFVDFHAPRRVVSLLERMPLDYVVECGLPVGAAVEAMTRDALERAAALTLDPYDREHVTPFIRRDTRFRQLRAVAPPELRRPSLSLTVDTPEDLAYARRLFDACPRHDPLPTLGLIIETADRVRRPAPAPAPVRRIVPPSRWRTARQARPTAS